LGDLENRIKGIELGVDDYLVKPINTHELKIRLNALIKKKAYLDQLQNGYKSAVRSAITDKLTGLYNYAYFTLFLENEIKRSIRHGHAIAVIMLDIDDFKGHNDALGHLAGDQILREFAKLLSSNLREIDLCFRYGGEEFAIVLPYTGMSQALGAAERLRQTISTHPFHAREGEAPRKVTASMGIAVYPSHASSADELMRKADDALYNAKRGGKNCVRAWEETVSG
jgi:two-component system cell cycle response regulator